MRQIFLILLMMSLTSISNAQKLPTNKHFWNRVETTADPNIIWKIWTDVSRWKDWDTGLKEAKMEETFGLKAKGIVTSLEGRKSKFTIVEFVEGQSYTFKTKLPLASLYVKRYLEEKEGKIYFTHEVWFKGLTAGIFAKAFGTDFREMLPEVMNNVKKLAEQ